MTLQLYNHIDQYGRLSEFGEFLTQPTLVIIGGPTSFNYLIQRYAERAGYEVIPLDSSVMIDAICNLRPLGVIFPTLENLEDSQAFLSQLTNQNIPIIVCSSVTEQARAQELGADYCLLHPFVYDNFSQILEAILSGDV